MKRHPKTSRDFSWLHDFLAAVAVILALFFVLLSVYPPTYSFTFKRVDLPVPSMRI